MIVDYEGALVRGVEQAGERFDEAALAELPAQLPGSRVRPEGDVGPSPGEVVDVRYVDGVDGHTDVTVRLWNRDVIAAADTGKVFVALGGTILERGHDGEIRRIGSPYVALTLRPVGGREALRRCRPC